MNNKGEQLYTGKAKSIYATDKPDEVIMEFRDDATAFNAEKHAVIQLKGRINQAINTHIMAALAHANIKTHFIKSLSATESLVKLLEMIPLECVVRNIAAGSLCRRLGIEEGREFDSPVFEFFLKSDSLGDPMINESHILTFGWATPEAIATVKKLSLQINTIIKPLFREANLLLVDFKLEFGYIDGEIVLGDEITPDGCRLWDAETKEKFDKDRFRFDLGDVTEGYREVAQRLNLTW